MICSLTRWDGSADLFSLSIEIASAMSSGVNRNSFGDELGGGIRLEQFSSLSMIGLFSKELKLSANSFVMSSVVFLPFISNSRLFPVFLI